MIESIDIIPDSKFYSGKALRIIIPTPSIESDHFKKCLNNINRAELPQGSKVTAVISNGPDFVFSKSVNYGLSRVNDEDILLLNDDCYIEYSTVRNLTASIKDSDGVVGGVLKYPDGKIQHSGGILCSSPIRIFIKDTINGAPFYSLRSFLKAKSINTRYLRTYHYTGKPAGKIDYVTGALFYIPNKAFRKIGYLDENLVNGFEDLDYCLRAKKLGLSVRLQNDAMATHEEHISLSRMTSNFFKNLSIFNEKWSEKDLASIS